MAERFVRDDGLPAYDAALMTQSLALRALLRGRRATPARQPKLVANWMMGEVSRRLNAEAIDDRRQPGGRRRRWPR